MRAFYFPIESGIYEVTPGLKPLGFDFGNGTLDAKLFQFDEDFTRVRAEKLAARNENLAKYFATSNLSRKTEEAAVETIIGRLTQEWPQHFGLKDRRLRCHLTNETLAFDAEWRLEGGTPYTSSLDALFMQVQEDGAILSIGAQDQNWLSFLHVMLPSHWDPREKIGRDFANFHKPVPGFERLAAAQSSIAQAMVHKGPFARFVWSFVTDARFNHHPEAPFGEDTLTWRGRSFDAQKSEPFFLRIERQTTWGLLEAEAALFFIRLSFIEGSRIREDAHMRTKLLSALKSMTPEARIYKGVDACFEDLTQWLQARA